MDAHQSSGPHSIGFASIRERSPHGYFGGFLVVNTLARPMEFHCTLPIIPTRAQQILFGKTLEEFLCGEQIARALLTKSKIKPKVVFTDCPAALSVRHWVDIPVFLISGDADRFGIEQDGFRVPNAARMDDEFSRLSLGDYQFQWLSKYTNDSRALEGIHEHGVFPLDLYEPFSRINEALSEANPRTKAA